MKLRLNKRLALFAAGVLSVPAGATNQELTPFPSPAPYQVFTLTPEQWFRIIAPWAHWEAGDGSGSVTMTGPALLVVFDPNNNYQITYTLPAHAPFAALGGAWAGGYGGPMMSYTDYLQALGSPTVQVGLDSDGSYSNADLGSAHDVTVRLGAIVEIYDNWERGSLA